MDTQLPIDYWKMFADLMARRAKLISQRDEAEVELAKMKQLIVSVFALLREDQQKANQQAIDDMEAESAGLQDQIKLVFAAHAGEWLTVSDVRDHANDMGFDFRQYKANPLASIKTTLKRLADGGYVQTSLPRLDGSGTLYMREAPLEKLKMLSDLLGRTIPEAVERDNMHSMAGLPGSPGVPLPNEDDIARENTPKDHPLHKLRANPRGRTVPPPPGLDALADIPNRFGKTLGDMLKQPEKKK
jgi:hypothetical protein